jgi:hypothetical protein
MTDRVLRSRAAEVKQDNLDSSAGESISELGSREASENLGSMGETEATSQTPVSESEPDPPQTVSQASVHQPSVVQTIDLNNMLAGIMTAIQQTQESVKKDLAATNESVKKDLAASNESVKNLAVSIESVKKDLVASNESIKKELAATNESVKKNLAATNESVRKDLAANNEKLQQSMKIEIENFKQQMKLENEALINRFDNQNKQTKKEFSGKLEAESRRLTNLVSQVQKETESELIGFKKQLQTVSSDFQEKLLQTSSSTQGLIEELASHVDERQAEMNTKLQELGKEMSNKHERQKEGNNQTEIEQKLELVSAKIVALENKVSEPRPAVVIEPLTNADNMPRPSVVHQSDQPTTAVQIEENRTCSCQSNTCQECMSNHNSTCRMNVGNNEPVSSFLSSSELPLPQFDEARDTNPVCHIRQLDEFMQFRGVPKALQLSVAYKSMVGQMSKQWAETATWNLKDYPEFRREFLKVWWSSSRQSLVKCRLYQGKYNRSSGMSLSAYFLQQATTASYLEPKLSDREIVEAVRFHYPIQVQRAMLSNQLTSIGEALDLLKRVEVMEANEGFQRPQYQAPQANLNARRQNQTSPQDQRAQPQNVRQVQVRSPRHNNNRNWRRWNHNQEERQPRLNPHAPNFQSNPQQETHSEN